VYVIQHMFCFRYTSKVLSCVRFLSATLLHLLKILQLLAVVPQLYRELKKHFHYGGKHGECFVCVCVCVHRNKTCSVMQGKQSKYMMGSQVTDHLTHGVESSLRS
jgi:hypothetical protein